MRSPRALPPRRLLPVVLLGLTLTALPGCAKKTRATVKGTVTFAGQPLRTGTVNFVTADKRTGSALIGPDGRYVMGDAPVGEVRVFIGVPSAPTGPVRVSGPPPGVGAPRPPDGEPPGPAPMPDPRSLPRLPERYTKAETTDLTYRVEQGEHSFDIRLRP